MRARLGDLVTWRSSDQTLSGNIVEITRRVTSDGNAYRYFLIQNRETGRWFGLYEHLIPKLLSEVTITTPEEDEYERICKEYDEARNLYYE